MGATGPQGPQGEPGPQGPAGSTDAWSLTGSLGTDPLLNFLGTLDDQPLVIRVNSRLAMQIADDPAGPFVGVGTSTPARRLHVVGATLIDGDLEVTGALTGHLSPGSIAGPELGSGAVNTTAIQDGTVGLVDLNLASTDGRYVLKAGDTMTGPLTAPDLTVPGVVTTRDIVNSSGAVMSIESAGDIELTIDRDNNGSLAAAFEIFNGAGQHAFLVSETGNGRVFQDLTVDGRLSVGGPSASSLAPSVHMQLDLPNESSIPRMRIQAPAANIGFGLEFSNPAENWWVGPNIGNWNDNRFNILADNSNRGLIIAANGNLGIGSVSAASPFSQLTVDGTIGFPDVASPMMFVYPSGTANARKPVIVHSPAFPGYGLFYEDNGDRFMMQSSPSDTTPSLVVDLDSNWVSIATDVPKPGYELSVNGQVVCEELLIQDSTLWADYVFEPGYSLRTLEEVEAHIQAHQHLPGIPAATEVAADGLRVGDMQRRMMEKIEELTLYVIQQNKRLAAQDARIQELEARIGAGERQP
jgi:hypothetical protein